MANASPNSLQPRVAPYILLAPFLLTFATFTLYPLIQSLILSTRQTFGPSATVNVGARNFLWLFEDPKFWGAMWNTFLFTAGSVFIQLPVAFGLAMLLNRRNLLGRNGMRLVFFSPQLVGLVFAAMISAVMLEKNTGLIPQWLEWLLNLPLIAEFGALEKSNWVWPLSTLPTWEPGDWLEYGFLTEAIMPTLIGIALWLYAGFNMIYFLAALQNVDQELVEASLLDGAGATRRFLSVTLPAVRPVAVFVVLLSIIGSFQLFELPFLLQDGDPDESGRTVVTYLYETGFQVRDLGYASAIGWVLALVLIGFAILNRLAAREGASA